MFSSTPRNPVSVPGVLGSEGRFRLEEQPARGLVLGGVQVLPVGPLRMYACGITPYDVTHMGHASTFVWADALASVAHATGVETVMVRNVTDVDDVLTQAASRTGWRYDELALTQEFLFDRAMKVLRVAPPTLAPHARGHVGAVVRLASALLASGAAYESEGFVYFRGAGAAAAAGLDRDAALAASQAYGDQDEVPGREDALDVAVWRPSPPEHPAWPSPWGWGRPGWHAECAAMALGVLGSSVDVLLGGRDLTFPHHAYQAAMVERATGVRPFARAVVHVGEVCHGGARIAKSTGNLVLVSDVVERHAPTAVRLALLDRRYADAWDCEEEVFVEAADVLARLRARADGVDLGHRVHPDVLALLATELDVPAAVSYALSGEGGPEAAAYLLELLKLR